MRQSAVPRLLFSMILTAIAAEAGAYTASSPWFQGKGPAVPALAESAWIGGWREAGDLTPDSRIIQGKLPNGFRYALLSAPRKGKVSLSLIVGAGSYAERPSERGYAHFTEHLAFTGSTHYPSGTAARFFEENGMKFGRDANAFTSGNRTVFRITLQKADQKTLSESLQVLSDFAGGVLFAPESVASERGVVLSELALADTEEGRTLADLRKFLYGGTQFEFLPAGDPAVISAASPENLKRFYRTWYVPQRMILAAAGDIRPDDLVPLIERTFGTLQAGTPPPVPYLGDPDREGVRAWSGVIRGNGARIRIRVMRKRSPAEDSAALRKSGYLIAAAQSVLTERLSRRAEAGGAPWVSAAAYIGIQDPYLPEASLRADGGSSSWEASLSALLAELKSAETGVTDEEAARAKRRIRTALESAVKAGIPDPDIAVEGMETELASGRVMTSPETDLVLFDAAASSITGKAISDAIREAFETGAVTIELMAPEKVPESDLLRAYESAKRGGSGREPVGSQTGTIRFPYLRLPPLPDTPALRGAERKAETRVMAQGVELKTLPLANGAKLSLLPEKNAEGVTVSLFFGPGTDALPTDRLWVPRFASLILPQRGVGRMSPMETAASLGSLGVQVSESYAAKTAVIQGTAPAQRLRTLFEAIWTQYRDPMVGEGDAARAAEGVLNTEDRIVNTMDGAVTWRPSYFFHGGNPAFAPLTQADTARFTKESALSWFRDTRNPGLIRILVTGSFDEAEVLKLAEQLFGNEIIRGPRPAAARSRYRFPAGVEKTETLKETTPRAGVFTAWGYTLSPSERGNSGYWAGRAAAAALDTRIRRILRSELGLTYSPWCRLVRVESDPEESYIESGVLTEAADIASVRTRIRAIAADLARHGITESEFSEIKSPLVSEMRNAIASSRFWREEAAYSIENSRVTDPVSELRALEGLTLSDVNAAIRRVFESRPAVLMIQGQKKGEK